MTYPEAATSSDETVARPRTKLLVEADGFIDDVLANLSLKLFIFVAKSIKKFDKKQIACSFKDLGRECAQ